MSLTKRTTRRLSLMAGSSLVAASLTAIVSAGAALAPTAAAAQATCTSGTAVTGNGTNNVTIAGGTNNPGITCAYVGDNALVSTAAATTVSSAAPGGGVNLTATGDDSINWSSSAGTVTGSTQTNGPVIDAGTATGDINLVIGGVTGTSNTVTHGVRAVSSGAGDITIFNGTASASVTVSATNATTGNTAIQAQSGGGDITIGSSTNRIAGNGRLYGIRAETIGAGSVTITGTGSLGTSGDGAVDAVAAIYASTTAGNILIDTTSGSITGRHYGSAIRSIAGGDAHLKVGQISMTRSFALGTRTAPLIHVTAAGGTVTTIDAMGFIRAGDLVDNTAIRADGAGSLVVNLSNAMYGKLDFAGLGGGADFNIASGGAWSTIGDSSFTAAGDTLSIAAGGMFAPGSLSTSTSASFGTFLIGDLGQGDRDVQEVTTVQFGGGDDRLTNAGVLAVGYGRYNPNVPFAQLLPANLEVDLYLLGLETFENSGSIVFGLHDAFPGSTDGRADDVLIMPGTNFIGSGDSLMMIDVNLNASQGACDPSLRDPDTFDMPAADCISMAGGSTSGVTRVLIKEQFPFDRGAYTATGIVLVDVAGGTGATGDFVIHEDSVGYSSLYGGSIDKGVFAYALVFDGETQQHKLVAAPTGNVLQYPLLAQAAHGIWRQSTGAWFDRQAEVRHDRDELGGGVWLRVSTEFADRDLMQSVIVAGNAFTLDNTHKQSTFAVTTGVDMITGDAGSISYVLGAMGGYTNSKVEFDTSPNRAQFDGYVAGLYGGVVAGGLFVDAAVTGNKLIMDHDVPGFGLLPEGTITSTDLMTYGAQAEAGWRFPVADRAFIEPLAAVSYTTAKFDDLLIVAADASRQGVEVAWEDPKSLRAGIGGRFGLEQDYAGYRARYTLLGRVWNEFEDETAVVLSGQGDPAPLFNEFSGAFSELGVGVALHNISGAVSGFFNFGSRFAEDYSAVTGAVGMRVAW